MSLDSSDDNHWQLLEKELLNTPVLSERILLDVANSISVVDNQIQFRRNEGHFDRLIAIINGNAARRQTLIDQNTNIAMTGMLAWMQHIVAHNTVSNQALQQVAQHLENTMESVGKVAEFSIQNRDLIDKLRDDVSNRISELDSKIAQVEIQQNAKDRIDETIAFWKLGRIYAGYPAGLQAILVLHDLSRGEEGYYIYGRYYDYLVAMVANTLRDMVRIRGSKLDFFTLVEWLSAWQLKIEKRFSVLYVLAPFREKMFHRAVYEIVETSGVPDWIIAAQSRGDLVGALSSSLLTDVVIRELRSAG